MLKIGESLWIFNEDKKLKKFLSILEKEFKNGNRYIMEDNITLAYIV